jgi:hypothetical protein
VPTTGSYIIRLRVASPSGATASVDLNSGTIQLGNFAIPCHRWMANLDHVSRTVTLNAGNYSLGVYAQTAGWNFNWIEVVPSSGGPSLVWSDDFNSINTGTWNHETGGGGWGNNEREYYTAGQNASIQFDAQANSNVLVLEARRDNPANYNCWYGRCEYTSSRMNTSGKRPSSTGASKRASSCRRPRASGPRSGCSGTISVRWDGRAVVSSTSWNTWASNP